MTLKVRPAEQSDLGFVIDNWLMTYSKHPSNEYVPWEVYHKEQTQLMDELVDDPGEMLLVAVDDSEPDFLLGFIVFELVGPTLLIDYRFARGSFIDDVGRLLIDFAVELTQPINIVTTHWSQRWKRTSFNPYLKFRRRTKAT